MEFQHFYLLITYFLIIRYNCYLFLIQGNPYKNFPYLLQIFKLLFHLFHVYITLGPALKHISPFHQILYFLKFEQVNKNVFNLLLTIFSFNNIFYLLDKLFCLMITLWNQKYFPYAIFIQDSYLTLTTFLNNCFYHFSLNFLLSFNI